MSARNASILAILLLGLIPQAAPAQGHPQDGPDADVRIMIGTDAVKFTVIANLAFLDEVTEVPREREDALHEVEYPVARDALFEILKTRNRVTIDGVTVAPLMGNFDVDPGDEKLLPLFPMTGMRALIKVRLNVTYAVKSPPKRVAMVWGPYPDDLLLATPEETPKMDITAQLLAGSLDRIIVFRHDEPEYVWHGDAAGTSPHEHLFEVPDAAPPAERSPSVPVLGLAALMLVGGVFLAVRRARPLALVATLGAVAVVTFLGLRGTEQAPQLPDEAEALAIFQPLHANIYRAFDYATESDIYDALASSVEGDLLETLYNQVYRGLIMQEEGGAVSRVKAVRPLMTRVESIGVLDDGRPGFQVRTRWQVDGAVHHWGHSHTRTNQYEADYTVVGAGGAWRIAGSKMIGQERVESAPMDEAERDGR